MPRSVSSQPLRSRKKQSCKSICIRHLTSISHVLGEWHQLPLLHPTPPSPLPSPLSSAALLRERQDGWLSSRPSASRSLIKGIVSPRMPCSVWQKGTRSPECYGLKRARVVWSAALHLRRALSRFNPMIIELFMKERICDKNHKTSPTSTNSRRSHRSVRLPATPSEPPIFEVLVRFKPPWQLFGHSCPLNCFGALQDISQE